MVSKDTNQVVCSLVFAQVSSGSGMRNEGEFCEQISVMPRCVLKIPIWAVKFQTVLVSKADWLHVTGLASDGFVFINQVTSTVCASFSLCLISFISNGRHLLILTSRHGAMISSGTFRCYQNRDNNRLFGKFLRYPISQRVDFSKVSKLILVPLQCKCLLLHAEVSVLSGTEFIRIYTSQKPPCAHFYWMSSGSEMEPHHHVCACAM